MADFKSLAADFSVAGQLQLDDLGAAAAAGVYTVICNRPDGEDPGQCTAQRAAEEADRLGMVFLHLPFTLDSLDRALIDAMQRAVQDAEGPVLAYCRSGTRCAIAWSALALRGGRDEAAVLGACAAAGYTLAPQLALIRSLA